MESKTVPVQLDRWIDCPQCGKFNKLSRAFRLAQDIAGPMRLKVQAGCERCGRTEAFLYLDRTVASIH